MAEKWIAGAIKHPGALRKSLHVKAGETIPSGKLDKAEHSENPTLAKRANLAKTLKAMHKKYGGGIDGGKSPSRLDRKPRG
ncbi:MAG: hypothetical protein ABSD44_17175 [Terracidiphilus sp.]|jgi:hypothetical protein